MSRNLAPDLALAYRLFDDLRRATADGRGVTRDAYGEGEARAHAIVAAAARALGLEVAADHAGNLLMTLPGRNRAAPRIVLGSHLDSVRQGGNYDGAAGVLAGLATVAGLSRAAFRPDRDITVVAIRAEEGGAWFPCGFPGSRAALGTLPAAALDTARLDTGISLRDHLSRAGFDPDAVAAGHASLPPRSIAAYLELHIEQGPVLDDAAIPVGIVTALPATRRYREGRVTGTYGHSGATPRRHRHDAAIALAKLACRLDDAWGALDAEGEEMVATFCVLGTAGAAGFTKVAGEAEFQLDMRSASEATLDRLDRTLHDLADRIAASRGVTVALGPVGHGPASPMDPALRAALARSADSIGVRHRAMPSGGGHDAAAFAAAGVPSAMLFVRNQNGSHNPDEAMRPEDFAAGVAVMLHWVAEAAGSRPDP